MFLKPILKSPDWFFSRNFAFYCTFLFHLSKMNSSIPNFWVISSAMVLCLLFRWYLLVNYIPAASRPLLTYLSHVLCLFALASFTFFPLSTQFQSLFILSFTFISHSPLLCVISTVAISVFLLSKMNLLIIVSPDWFFVSVYSLCLIVLLLLFSCCPLCFLVCAAEESLKTHKTQ